MNNDQFQQQDDANLRSLAIAFRILGVLYSLGFILAPIIFGLFQFLVIASQNASTGPQDALTLPSMLPGIFVVGLLMSVGVLLLWLSFKAARSMERRENWGFCIGVSIFFLLHQPLGLVLGILALIVLNRPSVRASFA